MIKLNIILLIIVSGCGKISPSIQSNGELVIVDSSRVQKNLLLYPNNHRGGYYPVYYLGKTSDTIPLGDQPIPRYEADSKKHNRPEDFTSPDSTKIMILVDTTFSLSHTELYRTFDETKNSWLVDSTKSYRAIPILIYNHSKSIIPVGHSNMVGYMVRQIKKNTGNWIDIETPIDYYCLTGARLLVIRPGETMVAKLLRHDGKIRALCRLKFKNYVGTVYSNTFIDFTDRLDIRKTESL